MADALLSPAVGGTMWAVAATLTVYSARRMREGSADRRVPLMGVLGAFVFAAQMINFAIPGTGSSGHLGGGLLLAVLLGPHAAFLAMASILSVQALLFADGGLLALGCNIVNLGLFPCFIVYPLVFKRIAGANPSRARLIAASVVSAVIGLQAGAFGVVVQTSLSGLSDISLSTFLMLMQPIHLAIGIVEGVVTATILQFVWAARPEALEFNAPDRPGRVSVLGLAAGFLVAALVAGGVLSWYASPNPDGLEWALAKSTERSELVAPEHGIHGLLASVTKATAVLPDYSFKKPPEATGSAEAADATLSSGLSHPERHPGENPRIETTVSGLVGGGITLLLAGLVGAVLRRSGQPARAKA